jgi:ABC-type Fe3+ transport system permease subunit
MLLPNLRNVWGASFVLIFCLYPYLYLFAHNSFTSESKTQIETQKLLGATLYQDF